MDVTELRQRLLRVLAAPGGVELQLAVLFGSMARGSAHPGSDVDIGIVPGDPSVPLSVELDLQNRLERACSRPVDLIRLDRAPVTLRWRVANEGIVLLDREREWPRFVARAALDHADIAPALHRAARIFRERLVAQGAE